MRQLHYIGGSLIVDDEVCLAVFHYAVALFRAGTADLVEIPILWNRKRDRANLVLSPSSQLYCTPADVDAAGVDLSDIALVEELTSRTAGLGPRRAAPISSAPGSPDGTPFDGLTV